jgi:hypothetical protein
MNGQPMLPKWPNDGSSDTTRREEPGKQKTRRRRAQELSRSCARKNAWWKWKVDRIVQLAFGETGVACCSLRDLRDARAGLTRNESLSQTRCAPGSRLLGGEPSTRRPVNELFGERRRMGKRGRGVRRTGRRIHRKRSRAEVKALTTR